MFEIASKELNRSWKIPETGYCVHGNVIHCILFSIYLNFFIRKS